jgi:hypothetical protein
LSAGFGRRVGVEMAKGLWEPMFRALELAIGSTVDGKEVGVREVVGDDRDSFFEPNFRNIEGVFMLGAFVQKDAAGERSSVAILKATFGGCNPGDCVQTMKVGARRDLQCLFLGSTTS